MKTPAPVRIDKRRPKSGEAVTRRRAAVRPNARRRPAKKAPRQAGPRSVPAKVRRREARTGQTPRTTASAKPTEVSVGTDAAFAPATGQPRRRLKNISEVRHFFRTNDVPILFFGATPFNLLGPGPLGPQLHLHHVLRRMGRRASAGVHAERQAVPRVRKRRGDQQLAADQPRGAGAHRLGDSARGPAQGRDGLLRQRNRGHLQGTRLRPDPARGKPAHSTSTPRSSRRSWATRRARRACRTC